MSLWLKILILSAVADLALLFFVFWSAKRKAEEEDATEIVRRIRDEWDRQP